MSAIRGVWLMLACSVVLGFLPGVARAQTSTPSEGPDPGVIRECTVCHALPEVAQTPTGVQPELQVTDAQIQGSVHSDFTCTDCHSPLTAMGHPAQDRALSSCAGCHEDVAAQYEAGAHGKPSELGVPPTCVTCHGDHEIVHVEGTDFAEAVSEKCADCHAQINEHRFGSNPLGMETHLGRLDLATCDDCHEAHKVLPPGDPASSVSTQNKLQTCRQCHTDAPQNFRDIQIHVASGPLPGDMRLRIATVWMLGILIFTFAFFGWLTVLGIRHEWRHGRTPRSTREGSS
jgi:hypothetical protein